MKVIRDFSLRYKLLFVFVLLALLMVAGLLTLRQLIVLQFSEDVVPKQTVVSEFGHLVREIQAETLEYISLGSEETRQEHENTSADLLVLAEQMASLDDDAGETEALAAGQDLAQAIIATSRATIASHGQTLDLLDQLEEAEEQKETAVPGIDRDTLLADQNLRTLLLVLNQAVVLAERLHTETLEFVITGEDSTFEEIEGTRASLQVNLNAVQANLPDADTAQLLNVQPTLDSFVEIMSLSNQIVASHSETLEQLEKLEELETEAEQTKDALLNLVEADAELLVRQTDQSLWAVGIFGQFVFIVLAVLIARAIVRPLLNLNRAAQKLGQGQYDTRLEVESKDEIGNLMLAFNGMAAQMQESVAELEQHTQAIETSSEVSHRLSTILDVEELTTAVVELLKVQFNYYHAHIYLFDEAREYLVMAGGTGAAGEALLSSGHKIAAGKGLVGRTAVNNKPTLVPDVSQDANWLPNPLLPDTKAEAAVPITLEGTVLGVLDVQNRTPGSLNADDVELLQSVAWQVAIGLQNARLFAQAQAEKAQVQNILDSLSLPIIISRISDGRVTYINNSFSQAALLPREEVVGKITPDFYADPAARGAILAKLQTEGQVSDFELVLKRGNGEQFWALLSAGVIIYEGAPAILASLLDIDSRKKAEAQLAKNASELEIVAQVSTVASTILTPQEMLQQVADLTKSSFKLYHAHIHLLDDSGQTLVLTAGAGEIGRQMVAEGRRIPLAAAGSLVASVARNVQGAIRNYGAAGEGFMPHPLLEATRSEMAVPIALGKQVLGVLDVRSDEPNYFGESDLQTVGTLASQVAVALQNARSYSRSEKALQELQVLSRRLTREGWDDYLGEQTEVAYNYDLREVKPHHNGNGNGNGETAVTQPNTPLFTQPLQIQGESIGQLTIPGLNPADSETVEIVTAVAERLSAHLENLRLTQSSEIARANAERRNEELGLINRMMSSVTASLDLVNNMHIIAQELAQALDVSHVGIALTTEDKQHLEVVTQYPEPTDNVIGTLIPIEGNPLTTQAMQTGKSAIAYDAQNNALTAPIHGLMQQRGIHMLAVVPMIVGNEFFGTVGFDQTDPNRIMSEQQLRLAETIVYQAATVVQNARLFNQTEEALAETNEQARRLALLNELSEIVSRQTTVADLVAVAMERVSHILEAKRISLHLLNEKDATMLRVAGIAGEVADTDLGEQLPVEGSPMGEALQTLQIASGYFQIEEDSFPAYFVPLFAGEQKFGTFNMVLTGKDKQLKDNDRQIILQIAAVLTAALENLRLFAQTRRRAEREQLLNKIVTQVAASLDLQHSLQIIVDEMATALNVDQVRVALIQPDGKSMQIIAEHYDPRSPTAVGMMVPLEGNELSQEVIRTRKLTVVEDAQNNPRTAPVHELFREQGIQTVVLIPLVVNDEVLGTIGLDILDERKFEEDTLQLAETIVYQAAVAIQNARLFEKSQAALAETEMLYTHSSHLNTATNFEVVLETASAPGFQAGAQDALLLIYREQTSSQPQYAEILASTPASVGPDTKRLRLSETPWGNLRPEIGKSIVLVGDIEADGRITNKNKADLKKQNIQALAIMYLRVGNLQIGQIIIRWSKCQTFTDVDERLFGAIAQQASSVVYNRLLFKQTEEALSETATLYQASADLNTAQTYNEVLTALRQHTILGQGAHAVTINYFDRPWDQEQTPEEVYFLTNWSAADATSIQPPRFKIDTVPGFRALVSSSELLVHNDVATDAQISDEFRAILLESMNAKAVIYAPLIIGTRRVGFINGYFAKTTNFSEEQVRRLNVLVRQAAVTIQSLQLLEQTRRRADREALINSINKKIQSAPTVQFALQTAVAELGQALNLKKAVVELTPSEQENGQQEEIPSRPAEPV